MSKMIRTFVDGKLRITHSTGVVTENTEEQLMVLTANTELEIARINKKLSHLNFLLGEMRKIKSAGGRVNKNGE